MNTRQTKSETFGGNLPEKKFKAGPISVAVWRNTIKSKDGSDADVMSVTFQRTYKDRETDEWKTTNSLRTMDLPKAVVVLNKAFEYLVLNNGQDPLAIGI